MILKNFSKFLSLLILFIFAFNVQADEKIDIWKNKNLQKDKNLKDNTDGSLTNKNKDNSPLKKVETTKKIEITDGSIEISKEANVFWRVRP